MRPRIVVEGASPSTDNVSSFKGTSVNSWKSTTTVRYEGKEEAFVPAQDQDKFSLKRWWSNTTQPHTGSGSPNWKPLSMTTPILSAVIIASLLMVAAIELLAQKSQRQGGLALSPSLKEIPQYAMITSQYIPQVLAVCYSLVWSWIDLDVKRMQPWFEMSKPEGALAGDSLLLDYPYTFVAFVPFKAAQRKHWLVFLSGLSMVLVFWAVTPLQSAQLGTGRVRHSEPQTVYQRSSLIPMSEQQSLLGVGIINTAYAIAWLSQPAPAFTTPKAAYLPFFINSTVDPTSITKTNYTGNTWRLSTELSCWPAEISRTPGPDQNTVNFLNGQGCNASVFLPSDEISMFYMGYYDSSHHGISLERQGNCRAPDDSKHQFLATWADVKGHYLDKEPMKLNITGAYCRPEYFKQEVRITVDALTLEPDEDSMEILSPSQSLEGSEFNITAFEFLLANGIEQGDRENNHDFPESGVNQQHLRITERNVAVPSSNMVAFALSQDKRNATGFSDFEVLSQAFNKAHQFLFSFAISQLLNNDTVTTSSDEAIATSFMSGIVVNRVISSILEGLILLITAFCGIIIWFSRSATANLDKNPSSIRRLAEICQNDPSILDIFCSVSHADDRKLGDAIKEDRFRLTWDDIERRPLLRMDAASPEKRSDILINLDYYYEPVKPAILRLGSGIAFVMALLGIMGGLIYLKTAELKFNGLRRPSPNQIVQQILENYIPTMLSTLIEPFWVLVNRLLCVFRPFKDLWNGKAKPDQSISTTYTSVPPQFAAWRAFKARHFLLLLVCSTVFLANVLTISLPAILQDEEITSTFTQDFVPQISTHFKNESIFGFRDRVADARTQSGTFQEHLYAALANMQLGTDLPPWVSEDYFFQPWSTAKEDGQSSQHASSYVVTTRGYGVDVNCRPISSFELPKRRTPPPENPTRGNCGDQVAIAGTIMREKNNSPEHIGGPCSVEHVATMDVGSDYHCQKTLTLGWGRTANATAPENSTVKASMAICNPFFQTATFETHVDLEGRVLSYKNTTEITKELDYPEFEEQSVQLIANANLWVQEGTKGWHNSTLSNDWMNHFLALEMDSRKHLDPSEPVPDPEELIPHLDVIYRKLFALLLGLEYKFLFETAPSAQTTQGKRHMDETRLFLDQPAFIISMIMLSSNLIMAAVLYLGGIVFVLPRMPTTIGSLITYIAPSRMMEDVDFEVPELQAQTFGFGRFIGRDGRAHVGIDLDSNVVRIEPSSIGTRRRRHAFKIADGSPPLLEKAQTWL